MMAPLFLVGLHARELVFSGCIEGVGQAWGPLQAGDVGQVEGACGVEELWVGGGEDGTVVAL